MFRPVSRSWAWGTIAAALTALVAAKEAPPTTEKPPIVVTAPQGLEFDQALNTWSGESVTIVQGDLRITADKARVDMDKKEAYADGNVWLHQGGKLSVSDSLFYDFNTGKAHFINFRGYQKQYYLIGKTADKEAEGEYRLNDGYLTTCDYDDPHWRIRANTLEIHEGHLLVAHQVRWILGDKTVMTRDTYTRDLNNNQATWTIVPGYRTRFGPFVLMTYNWYANEDLSGAIHADYRGLRGPGTGADFQYNLHELGRGLLSGYYAYDFIPRELDGHEIGNNRYRFHWEHRVELPQDITVTALVNKLSDDSVEKDFFSHFFRSNIEPDTYFEAVKREPNWTLTLLARPQINSFFTTTERLPELALDAQRQPLFHSPIFYESESSIANLHQSFDGSVGLANFEAVRMDTFHQLLFPHTYWDWLSITPKVGVRGTYYNNSPDTSGGNDIGRLVFNTGVEASFKASRTWDYNNDKLDIHGLRHIIQPTLEYSFVNSSRDPSELFQFDTTFPASGRLPFNHLRPLSFPQFDQIDAINNTNVLRFGLRNKLQTKRDDQTLDLVDLNVFLDWHLDPSHTTAPLDEPLLHGGVSNLFLDFKLRPTRWLGFRLDARYDVTDGELNELNTETRFIPNDRLNIGLVTRYLNQSQTIFGLPSSLIGTDIHLKLNEQWSLRMTHRFEMENGTLEEQEYTIARDLHDWIFAVGVRELHGGELQVVLYFTLKAFPAHVRVGG